MSKRILVVEEAPGNDVPEQHVRLHEGGIVEGPRQVPSRRIRIVAGNETTHDRFSARRGGNCDDSNTSPILGARIV
jgi:hypothetical protein